MKSLYWHYKEIILKCNKYIGFTSTSKNSLRFAGVFFLTDQKWGENGEALDPSGSIYPSQRCLRLIGPLLDKMRMDLQPKPWEEKVPGNMGGGRNLCGLGLIVSWCVAEVGGLGECGFLRWCLGAGRRIWGKCSTDGENSFILARMDRKWRDNTYPRLNWFLLPTARCLKLFSPRMGWPFLWNCHWLLKPFLKLTLLRIDGLEDDCTDFPFGIRLRGEMAVWRRVIEGIYVENEALV